MCFEISSRRASWKETKVYKVALLTRKGQLTSMIYPYDWTSQWVHTLTAKELQRTHTKRKLYINGHQRRYAESGFYVYRSLTRAQSVLNTERTSYHYSGRWSAQNPWPVLLELSVEPEDFLFASKCDSIATYKRVTVSKIQRDIEWEYV